MMNKFIVLSSAVGTLLSAVSAITTPSRVFPADDGKFFYMELQHKKDAYG